MAIDGNLANQMKKEELGVYANNESYRKNAEKLYAEISLARKVLSMHKPSIGYWGESILRDFLRHHLSSNVRVTSGFIFHKDNVDSEEIKSHQCDIIIYDVNYTPIHSFGEIELIPSCAVIAVIEVKSSIKRKTFEKTLSDFDLLGQMGIRNKYVFVFSSPSPKTIKSYFFDNVNSEDGFLVADCLNYKYDHGSFETLPTAIVSLNSDFLLCQDYIEGNRDMYGYAAYTFTYPTKSTIASLQLFLGMIVNDCAANLQDSNYDDSEKCFDKLKVLYEFGLWDL